MSKRASIVAAGQKLSLQRLFLTVTTLFGANEWRAQHLLCARRTKTVSSRSQWPKRTLFVRLVFVVMHRGFDAVNNCNYVLVTYMRASDLFNVKRESWFSATQICRILIWTMRSTFVPLLTGERYNNLALRLLLWVLLRCWSWAFCILLY